MWKVLASVGEVLASVEEEVAVAETAFVVVQHIDQAVDSSVSDCILVPVAEGDSLLMGLVADLHLRPYSGLTFCCRELVPAEVTGSVDSVAVAVVLPNMDPPLDSRVAVDHTDLVSGSYSEEDHFRA